MAGNLPLGYLSPLPYELLSMILPPATADVNVPCTAHEQRERLLLAAKLSSLSRAWRALAHTWWSRLEFEVGRHPVDPTLLAILESGTLEHLGQHVKHLTLTSQVRERVTHKEAAAETIPLNFRNLCTAVESVTLATEITTATYWTDALYAPPLPRLERLTCVLSFGLLRFLCQLEAAPSLKFLAVTLRRSARSFAWRWFHEPYAGVLPTLSLHELCLVADLSTTEPNAMPNYVAAFGTLVRTLTPIVEPNCLTAVDIAYCSEHEAVIALLIRCRSLRRLALRPTTAVAGNLRSLAMDHASAWPALEQLEIDLHPQELLLNPNQPISEAPLKLADWIVPLPRTLIRLDLAFVLELSDKLRFARAFADPAHPHLIEIGGYVLGRPSTGTASRVPIRTRWQRGSEYNVHDESMMRLP
ncbi:hypothetical protein JCM3774_002193 [Rhodotorula dairenensis]